MWWCAVAWAGQVTVVVSDDVPAYEQPVQAFLDALGQDAEVLRLHGRESELPAVSARLAADPPDAVFAVGAKAGWVVQRATPTVPLVLAGVREPERYGLVGPMVTGVTLSVPPETTLSQFHAFFPDVATVGVVAPAGLSAAREAELVAASEAVGVGVSVLRVDGTRALRGVLHRARDIEAVWWVPSADLLTSTAWRTVLDETRRRQLPLLVDTTTLVRAGGTFAVAPDPVAVGQQAAALTQRILAGDLAADLPMEAPGGRLVALHRTALAQAGWTIDPLLADFVDVLVH